MDPHHCTIKSQVNVRTTNTRVPLNLREGRRKVGEEKESGRPTVLRKMGEKEKWRELEGKNGGGGGTGAGQPWEMEGEKKI